MVKKKTTLVNFRIEEDIYKKYKNIVGGNISEDLRNYVMYRINQTTIKSELETRLQHAKNDLQHKQTEIELIEQQLQEIKEKEDNKELQNQLINEAMDTIKRIAFKPSREQKQGITLNEIDRISIQKGIDKTELKKQINLENIQIITEQDVEYMEKTNEYQGVI